MNAPVHGCAPKKAGSYFSPRPSINTPLVQVKTDIAPQIALLQEQNASCAHKLEKAESARVLSAMDIDELKGNTADLAGALNDLSDQVGEPPRPLLILQGNALIPF